jgi:hypothetical protein
MDKLLKGVMRLAALERACRGLVSRPLLACLNEWLALADKFQDTPRLNAALADGLDVDFTGTRWETEWLDNGKVCYCEACVIVRERLADIETEMGK